MAKQGGEYIGKYGFKMSGPFPAIDGMSLPRRSGQGTWHIPSKELMSSILSGNGAKRNSKGFALSAPTLDKTDRWEYELAGVFLRPSILSEILSEQEHKEELRKR